MENTYTKIGERDNCGVGYLRRIGEKDFKLYYEKVMDETGLKISRRTDEIVAAGYNETSSRKITKAVVRNYRLEIGFQSRNKKNDTQAEIDFEGDAEARQEERFTRMLKVLDGITKRQDETLKYITERLDVIERTKEVQLESMSGKNEEIEKKPPGN